MLEWSTTFFLVFSLGFQPNNKKRADFAHCGAEILPTVDLNLKKDIKQKVGENLKGEKEWIEKSERDQRKEKREKA